MSISWYQAIQLDFSWTHQDSAQLNMVDQNSTPWLWIQALNMFTLTSAWISHSHPRVTSSPAPCCLFTPVLAVSCHRRIRSWCRWRYLASRSRFRIGWGRCSFSRYGRCIALLSSRINRLFLICINWLSYWAACRS